MYIYQGHQHAYMHMYTSIAPICIHFFLIYHVFKNLSLVPKKSKNWMWMYHLPVWCIPTSTESCTWQWKLHVHASMGHPQPQRWEGRAVHEGNVAHTLWNTAREESHVTFKKMDGTGDNHVEWAKPDSAKYMNNLQKISWEGEMTGKWKTDD